MKAVFLRRCALLLALPLAACASSRSGGDDTGGMEVARFHLGQAAVVGQIAVEPFDQADGNDPQFGAYAASVARQLTRLGWTIAPRGTRTEQVALVDVDQGTRTGLQASRVGAGSAAAASTAAADTVATRLEVRIRRRSDGTVFWEGRALMDTRGGANSADRAAIVENLAAGLFRDFPGESGRTIRVK